MDLTSQLVRGFLYCFFAIAVKLLYAYQIDLVRVVHNSAQHDSKLKRFSKYATTFFNVESRVLHQIVAHQELFSVVKPGFSLAHKHKHKHKRRHMCKQVKTGST